MIIYGCFILLCIPVEANVLTETSEKYVCNVTRLKQKKEMDLGHTLFPGRSGFMSS